jgi:hypothetical protein
MTRCALSPADVKDISFCRGQPPQAIPGLTLARYLIPHPFFWTRLILYLCQVLEEAVVLQQGVAEDVLDQTSAAAHELQLIVLRYSVETSLKATPTPEGCG